MDSSSHGIDAVFFLLGGLLFLAFGVVAEIWPDKIQAQALRQPPRRWLGRYGKYVREDFVRPSGFTLYLRVMGVLVILMGLLLVWSFFLLLPVC